MVQNNVDVVWIYFLRHVDTQYGSPLQISILLQSWWQFWSFAGFVWSVPLQTIFYHKHILDKISEWMHDLILYTVLCSTTTNDPLTPCFSTLFPTPSIFLQITSELAVSATVLGISLVDIICVKWNSLDHCQWISVSTNSVQLYKKPRDTERQREREQGREERGEGTNRWINELSGEKGICAFIVPTTPLLLDSRVYAISAFPLLLSLHCVSARLPIEIALWH